MRVPFLDLKAQHAALAEPLGQVMTAVMAECAFVGGRWVGDFEAAFAAAIGARHCLGVGNGTDALAIALRAAGIGKGDEVITAANTFIATAEAITMAGARPVFVDCADDYLIDVAAVARAIGPATRAIVPVHLYGAPADMTALLDLARRHDLRVIADAAQAHGATHGDRPLGGLGDAICYSFYPGKILGACGDGGAIVSDDSALIERARLLANHGSASKYRHVVEGVNSRLDGLQAAALSVKLPHLPAWVTARRHVARRYHERLSGTGLDLPGDPPWGEHAYHLYVIRIPERDRIAAALAEAGIDCGIHYPTALPNLPAYAHLGHRQEDFPRASAYQDEILSLPIYPELSPAQIDHVCDRLVALL